MLMKLIKGMIQHLVGRLILLAIILLILIIAEGIRYHSPKEEIEWYRKMEEERQEDSWMEENNRTVGD